MAIERPFAPRPKSVFVMQTLSLLRARLASFEHAYVLATRLRHATGCRQYVVRTDDPIQPVHVTATPPVVPGRILAWIY